ncbi:MAG: hypothetical protein LBS25_00290 [Candidatus Symbiothrix sp.]|jgi:hypothetical protein|nr:hypothetical protein [Candidatus Symbiothrix sp.]
MKAKLIQNISILALIISLFSCKSTKFVPEGNYLLDKVTVESDVPAYQNAELKPYMKQQPNFKMFGLGKVMLGIYNLSGKKDNGWNRFIRRLGDEPILFDSLQVNKTVWEFQKLFVNMGYVNVEVMSDVSYRNKKANVHYTIHGNEPYRIRNYETAIDDSVLNLEMDPKRGSLVRNDLLFDRNILDDERNRLTAILKNSGYFAFSKDRLVYEADTALNAHSVDLNLQLRELPDSVIDLSNRPFFHDKFRIYLDFDPLRMSNPDEYPKTDSIVQNDYTIYYQGKKPSLRPGVLINHCFISPGEPYSQLREDLTYSAFSNLQALSNIHLQFSEKIRNDSTLLEGYLLAIPAKKQAVSYTVEGTNTAGDLGVATTAIIRIVICSGVPKRFIFACGRLTKR